MCDFELRRCRLWAGGCVDQDAKSAWIDYTLGKGGNSVTEYVMEENLLPQNESLRRGRFNNEKKYMTNTARKTRYTTVQQKKKFLERKEQTTIKRTN